MIEACEIEMLRVFKPYRVQQKLAATFILKQNYKTELQTTTYYKLQLELQTKKTIFSILKNKLQNYNLLQTTT